MAGKKRESLEQLARAEAAAFRREEEQKEENRQNAERLSKEVPPRFFELAKAVRHAVDRFNKESLPERRLSYRESAALTAHETANLNGDFNIWLQRDRAEIFIFLAAQSRSRGPDFFFFGGRGRFGDENFELRIDGHIVDRKIDYRMRINRQPVPLTLDEFPERLVEAVVRCSLTTFSET